MSTRLLSRRNLLRLASLAPLGVLPPRGALAQSNTVTTCASRRMGTVGLVQGQLLRVSLFEHADQVPGNPSTFQIEVFGLDGKVLGSAPLSFFPNAGSFFDFDLAAGLGKGLRRQVHVHASRTDQGTNPFGATLEVFDPKTGLTAMTTTPCSMPAPDPLMTHGSVGVLASQVVRVSLFQDLDPNFTESCRYEFGVYTLDGKPVEISGGCAFSPTQEAPADDFVPAGPARYERERLQVHVDVRLPEDRLGLIGAALEVYDAKTGRTATLTSPCVVPMGSCSCG